jgi:hypothetical protein
MPEEQVVTPPVSNPPSVEQKKWVREIQPTDENGNPIGHLQRFEADTQQELIDKLATAHLNGSKLIYELKTGKAKKPDLTNAEVSKNPPSSFKPRDFTADEAFQTTLEMQNPATARQAVRKIIEAEFGAPLDEVRQSVAQARNINYKFEVDSFLSEHSHDYYPCQQNLMTMNSFLEQNNLVPTGKNLNLAFDYLKDSLVQRPVTPSTEALPPQAQAIPENTGTISQPVQRTQPRSVSTGIIPGQFSGSRPGPKPEGLTMEIINKMSYDRLKAERRNPSFEAAYLKLLEKNSSK